MKDYKEVIQQRYDVEENSVAAYWNNIYSLNNKVGYYAYYHLMDELFYFVNVLRCENIDKKKILDVGCGIGANTRMLAEFFGAPSCVYGMEFSKNRIEKFREKILLLKLDMAI